MNFELEFFKEIFRTKIKCLSPFGGPIFFVTNNGGKNPDDVIFFT